jgi:rubrerythrin
MIKDMSITNLPELLAHALAIEEDAHERYVMLADQMEQHNNSELCGLFLKLASHEEHHAQEIRDRAGDIELPHLKLSDLKWPGSDSPEAAEFDEAHYKMTSWHALQMALKAEQRAFDFFETIVSSVEDEDLKRWAQEFRDEEAEHVVLVEQLLERYPKPAGDWSDDPDPPNLQG